MKTRQGFVSNSSSSSFVLVVDKKTAEEVKKEISPYSKAVVDAMKPEELEFNNIFVLVYEGWEEADSSSFDNLNVKNEQQLLKELNCEMVGYDWEEKFYREVAFKEFQNAIPNNKRIIVLTK